MKARLDTYVRSYKNQKGFIVNLLWYFTNILVMRNRAFVLNRFKVLLLKVFGCRVGKGVVIKPGVSIKYPWLLNIGDHSWIGEGVVIDNLANVDIASNCCVSQNAYLLTGSHNYKKPSFDLIIGDITIEEGVWIGSHSIVCPGVRCKSHSILTVNSVATKDLEAYKIYQGNPAEFKRIRKIEISKEDKK